MRPQRTGPLVLPALFLVICVACAGHAQLPSGAIAVPTDDNLMSSAQSGIACNASAVVPAVTGVLAGDASDSAWPVWLQSADGNRLYVRWPRGFSAKFDSQVTLLDETGAVVLHEGQPITLEQVGVDPSLGTRQQPYVAEGLWETGLGGVSRCYKEGG